MFRSNVPLIHKYTITSLSIINEYLTLQSGYLSIHMGFHVSHSTRVIT